MGSHSFEVTIDKLVYGGLGLGRHEGKVVFVPFSAPGDRLRVRPVQEKKHFTRASIVGILRAGPGRVPPLCAHFGKCGGCQWQHLEYSRQVEAKQQILEQMFHRLFPQTRELSIPMKACPRPYGYRSRARIQSRGFHSKSSIGFFRYGSHRVEDVEHCPLLRPALNEALTSYRKSWVQMKSGHQGSQLEMACCQEEGSWSIAGVDSGLEAPGIKEVTLQRKVGEFKYSLSASVFFQANDFMLAELVSAVLQLASGAGNACALDLFSGVGLFSLPLARQFKEVIAVDNSPSACHFCLMNASEAGLNNIQVLCTDVASSMMEEGSISGHIFDLVLLDPPRTGAGVAVMERIRRWAPRTIIYVSCDPQTLGRDLAGLTARNYRIDCIEGLDLFPQTYHFDTVVRLTKFTE